MESIGLRVKTVNEATRDAAPKRVKRSAPETHRAHALRGTAQIQITTAYNAIT
jgi:hypothetical protein